MSKPIKENQVTVPEHILFELLTPSEVRMVKNRWKIISLMEEGLPIRKIAAIARVGTDTVVRMSKKRQNLKIRQYLGKGIRAESASKWVFGLVKES